MIDFAAVENVVRELKKQLTAGQIDEQTFEDHLLQMIDVAPDGYYWMFGHETGRWFRHDGQTWQPDDPGRLLDPRARMAKQPLGHHNTDHSSDSEERSIDWDWLIASLVIMLAVGWIVYVSSVF